MAEKFSQQAVLEPGAPALTGRATLGATIGNMLEFYDFVTYSFFAIQIGRTFFPSHSQFASLMLSLATFGAGFVTRPIGALVIGAYSDRVGRRPTMILSFTMMGSAIIALAVTPSYDAIGIAAPILVIVVRLVQGFSLGGEVGPTTAYLMEAAAVGRRGLAVSCQPASQQIAATAGPLMGVVLSEVMTSEALDSYGWRIDWNNLDYYWVPGTWVEPPHPGLLWTPGYWGFVNGLYIFNQGYWGPHVGFYGGISYGFGYGGSGYQGGRWNNGAFSYNSSVNNIGSANITNVYNEKVVTNNVTPNNTSFNGGKNGTVATPTAEEEAAAKEPHEKPTSLQAEHARVASMNTASFASMNHGKPAVAATARPGALTSPDVIKAKATDAPVTPPTAKGAVVPAKKPQKTPEKVELKAEPKAEAKPAVEKPAKVAEPVPNVSKPKVSGPTVDKPAKIAEPTPSVSKPKVPGPALQKPKPDKPKRGQPHEPACH